MHFTAAQAKDIHENTEVMRRASCMILIDDIVMMMSLKGDFAFHWKVGHTAQDCRSVSSLIRALFYSGAKVSRFDLEGAGNTCIGTYFSLDGGSAVSSVVPGSLSVMNSRHDMMRQRININDLRDQSLLDLFGLYTVPSPLATLDVVAEEMFLNST